MVVGAGPVAIVSGMIAATPHQGGATWAVLQYILGLRRLGYDVVFVEPVGVDDVAASDEARYCEAVMRRFGLDRWALLSGADDATAGLARSDLRDLAERAELLLNISGTLDAADLLEPIGVRVFVDLDPAFVQIWHDQGIDMGFDRHTHFVTVSDSVGAPGGPIPACGRTWLPTLPPVVLGEWPTATEVEREALTTVAHWRGYGSVDVAGVQYGQKAHSLRRYIDLPRHVDLPIVLALGIHPDETADLAALDEHGWQRVDPLEVAATPEDYQRFVQGSLVELGVAKSGYVLSDSGWFSDRTACYLASGRPVIAQDTGFGRRLPTGSGLFGFAGAADVVSSLESILADYPAHRAAARAVAEDHLESDRVLTSLLDRVLT